MAAASQTLPMGAEVASNAMWTLEGAYQAHAQTVLRTAYRLTGRMQDAEDVLQTVFLRLSARAPQRVENLEGYMRRAAVNAALDVLRSRQTWGEVELGDELVSRRASSSFEAAHIRDSLRIALRSLSPRAAEAFVLRFVEGHDNREIAKMLNTSSAVIAVLLHRTRRQLQKALRNPAPQVKASLAGSGNTEDQRGRR